MDFAVPPFVIDRAPNLELLRRHGWHVGTAHGIYCVVWRGNEEVLMMWTGEGWNRVHGGGPLAIA